MAKIPVLVELNESPATPGMAMDAMMMAPIGPALEVDPSFRPVIMRAGSISFGMMADDGRPAKNTVVVRANVEASQMKALANSPKVLGVYSDPMIAPLCNCNGNAHSHAHSPHAGMFVHTGGSCGQEDCSPTVSTGTAQDVADRLGVRNIWNHGFTGQGVVIGILDGGVDGSRYPVLDGWAPTGAPPPGVASHWGGHGNMCAFDSLIAAPNAKIYDLGIGKTAGAIPTFLSGVLAATEWAVKRYMLDGTPQVLSNSWGLYQESWDPFPPGDPGNYTRNPMHLVNRKFIEAIDQGMLVAFAAGNCGSRCPDGRCGGDVGEGRSIRGAAGLERSICVGAVNLQGRRIGYSSDGPGPVELDPTQTKPDLCGYSHFTGHFPVDNGTSAACPVVAGVLALFRSALPQLRQDQARAAFNTTAINICAPGFDRQSGHGIINPVAAFGRLTGTAPLLLSRIPPHPGSQPCASSPSSPLNVEVKKPSLSSTRRVVKSPRASTRSR